MINFSKYFSRGLHGTLRLINGTNLSFKGPWVQVYPNTVVDKWYVGDFMSAEYTISVDYDTDRKELIKALVVASPTNASVVIIGRTNLGQNLINLSVEVNASTVSLIANPVTVGPTVFSGSKLIFSATYHQTLNELQP